MFSEKIEQKTGCLQFMSVVEYIIRRTKNINRHTGAHLGKNTDEHKTTNTFKAIMVLTVIWDS